MIRPAIICAAVAIVALLGPAQGGVLDDEYESPSNDPIGDYNRRENERFDAMTPAGKRLWVESQREKSGRSGATTTGYGAAEEKRP